MEVNESHNPTPHLLYLYLLSIATPQETSTQMWHPSIIILIVVALWTLVLWDEMFNGFWARGSRGRTQIQTVRAVYRQVQVSDFRVKSPDCRFRFRLQLQNVTSELFIIRKMFRGSQKHQCNSRSFSHSLTLCKISECFSRLFRMKGG